MQLGVLAKLLDKTSLFNHSPEREYQALSVKQVGKQVEEAACPTWYMEAQDDIYRKRAVPHRCPAPGSALNVATRVAGLTSRTWNGLDMTEYGKGAT